MHFSAERNPFQIAQELAETKRQERRRKIQNGIDANLRAGADYNNRFRHPSHIKPNSQTPDVVYGYDGQDTPKYRNTSDRLKKLRNALGTQFKRSSLTLRPGDKLVEEYEISEAPYQYKQPKTRHIPIQLHSMMRERVGKYIDHLNAQQKAAGSPMRHSVRYHYIGPRETRPMGRRSSNPASTPRKNAHSFSIAHHIKKVTDSPDWKGHRVGYIHAEDLGVHLKKNKLLKEGVFTDHKGIANRIRSGTHTQADVVHAERIYKKFLSGAKLSRGEQSVQDEALIKSRSAKAKKLLTGTEAKSDFDHLYNRRRV